MRHTPCIAVIVLLAILSAGLASAQLLGGEPPVSLDVEFASVPVSEKGPVVAVVTIRPDKGWYTYAHDPGGLGKPTVLTARAEGRPEPLPVAYPVGVEKPDPFNPKEIVRLYPGETRLFVALPAEILPTVRLSLHLDLLMCSDKSCMPGVVEKVIGPVELDPQALAPARTKPWAKEYVAARFDVGTPQDGAEEAAVIEEGEEAAPGYWNVSPRYLEDSLEVQSLWRAILLGFLAGIILNFMPCVLPVVSLKIAGILSSCTTADCLEARARTFLIHNVYFSLGILVYFFALSLVLSSFGLAWGQLFQEPIVILMLIAMVFGLGLSLFGLYDLPIIDMKKGPDRTGNPRMTAFSTGLLATLLATPCSGPLLGGVLAWSLLQPQGVLLAVFMSIGLGMASPYLAMALWPSLSRFFPRPGVWNQYLEKFVAFFLMATCIYLLQILPEAYLVSGLILLWVTGVACWMWGQLVDLRSSDTKRWIVRTAAVIVFAAGLGYSAMPPAPPAHWEELPSAELRAALGQDPVLVDFTADWCVSCKFLERTVLTPQRLQVWQERYGLRFVRVDLTEPNPGGEGLLEALGAKSIPTVAIFPNGKDSVQPMVLRDLFTVQTIEQALAETLR
jgi:thiol:disulfide interchange protein DsbD